MKLKIIFLALIGLVNFFDQVYSQNIIAHPVPSEFRSKQYNVEVNGSPVPVFQASPRVHFASFDFTGEAKVKVIGKVS